MQPVLECARSSDVYSACVPPRARRTVLVAAVLPLVVLIGLRSAWAAYACRMDGQIREACCCPKQETNSEHAPADGAPRMAASSCCDVTIGEAADTPQLRETARCHADDAPLVLVTIATDSSVVRPVDRRVPSNAFARPPPSSVPTYLANRSILR